MTLVLLFLLVSGPVGLLGSLVIRKNQEQSLQLARKSISSHSVGRNEVFGRGAAVLVDGIDIA